MYQNPLNTVCKLPTEHEMVIFDDTAFAQMLMSESGPKDYQSAVNFSKMCTIRVSFVKGWGNDYHRQDVTSTPCWIEIHLSSPMKWIDNILRQLESPDNHITSVSWKGCVSLSENVPISENVNKDFEKLTRLKNPSYFEFYIFYPIVFYKTDPSCCPPNCPAWPEPVVIRWLLFKSTWTFTKDWTLDFLS